MYIYYKCILDINANIIYEYMEYLFLFSIIKYMEYLNQILYVQHII